MSAVYGMNCKCHASIEFVILLKVNSPQKIEWGTM
jgi:hypothetical protein